jgi:stage II sporulation protein AA (anti-sigma F factor antagonist)
MSQLDIHIDRTEKHVVVRLCGEADIVTYKSLMDAAEKISQEKPKLVVFDFSELNFINSLSLGCLVKLRGELKHTGGSVRLAALKPSVSDTLNQSRLSWVIPIFPTVEMALVSLD